MLESPSPLLWDRFDEETPPRWMRWLAGALLGGASVALALTVWQAARQTRPSPSAEPAASSDAPPASQPKPSEPNWSQDEVTLELDGITIVGLTHVGKARSNNQDTFRLYPLPELGPDYALLLVCDGMGGHAGGEVASDLAATLISNVVKKQGSSSPESLHECLHEALHRADAAIEQRASKERALNGMGTTAVAAVVWPQGYVHSYIGDSRLYQVEGQEITYMTRDHSVMRLLLEEGIISEAEAKVHPLRSQLTSSLGGGKDANRLTVEPKWQSEPSPYRRWADGTWLLLCSDGLNSELSNPEIQRILQEASDPRAAARSLLAAALETEARDNITIVVARRTDR